MELSEAVNLIRHGVTPADKSQTWADLGAGSGLFTQALSTLLPADSIIYPIDTSSTVNSISIPDRKVMITPIQSDMTKTKLNVSLDGVIMANSLHFVKDQTETLQHWINSLNSAGKIIIVEYDMQNGNQWVPFPISFKRLEELSKDLGCARMMKLAQKPSVYNHSCIYAALLQF